MCAVKQNYILYRYYKALVIDRVIFYNIYIYDIYIYYVWYQNILKTRLGEGQKQNSQHTIVHGQYFID